MHNLFDSSDYIVMSLKLFLFIIQYFEIVIIFIQCNHRCHLCIIAVLSYLLLISTTYDFLLLIYSFYATVEFIYFVRIKRAKLLVMTVTVNRTTPLIRSVS